MRAAKGGPQALFELPPREGFSPNDQGHFSGLSAGVRRSSQGLHNALEMPRVGMAVAIPSNLNTLLQTLSCTAFAIASKG